MAKGLRSEQDAERALRRLVRKWRRRLGLRDEQVAIRCGDAATDEDMRGKQGYVEPDTVHNAHIIRVNRRHNPRYYERIVVHELLHLRWGIMERAFDELPEPARTAMTELHHSAIERVAAALTGGWRHVPWGSQARLEIAPWERQRRRHH